MRLLLVFVVMSFVMAARAQSVIQNRWLPNAYSNNFAQRMSAYDSSRPNKWSFNKYVSLSTGYSFFKGGNASFVAAPVGLQLNRRLTNNLYAFTGLSVAPLYMNFNGTFIPGNINKTDPGNYFMKSNSFGMNARAELGLMYVNDAKTFSISGSIGVERNSMPVFYPNSVSTRQNPVFVPNK